MSGEYYRIKDKETGKIMIVNEEKRRQLKKRFGIRKVKTLRGIFLLILILLLIDLFNPFLPFIKSWNIFSQLKAVSFYIVVYVILCFMVSIFTGLELEEIYWLASFGPITYYLLKGVIFTLLIYTNVWSIYSIDPTFCSIGEFWLFYGANIFWFFCTFWVAIITMLVLGYYIKFRLLGVGRIKNFFRKYQH